jgi:UDP-N-acetylglucosamine diphosphorylase/glucosamine-1-phosphate N-acetyltransferase
MDVSTNSVVVILAAGKGTRMKSAKAKVLHHIARCPMIMYVVETAAQISGNNVVVVVGNQGKKVQEVVSKSADVIFAYQKEQKGTGHAVMSAMSVLPENCQNVVILSGDVPLIKPATIKQLISEHDEQGNEITILGVKLKDPYGYGRIIINQSGNVEKIVEQTDASDVEKNINIVNSGIYCVKKSFLEISLAKITSNNMQNEIYLTDIVGIANMLSKKIGMMICKDHTEVMGVNTREDLENIEALLMEF